MCKPSIILADDNPNVLRAIRPILEAEFDVVAVVSDGLALVEQVGILSPDVAVTDISMPVLDGLAAARRILDTFPDTKVVFLTIHHDPAIVDEARSMGVSGYVPKTSADADLVMAVREALAGRRYFSPALGLPEPSG